MPDGLLQQRVVLARPRRGLAERLSPPRWIGLLRQDLADLSRFRYALYRLVAAELRTRYQRSVLGFFWTLLNPMLMMAVMALVFSQVMRLDMADYALYLFSGLIPWQFFSGTLTNSSRCLLASESLIKKIEVPKVVFPLTCLLVAVVNMIFAFAALFILFIFMGVVVHPQLVLLPVGIVLMGVFALGLSMVAMTLVSRFRDFEHIIAVLLQAGYFLCPVLYPPEFVARYPGLLTWNPMYYQLTFFHDAFYYGVWPAWPMWALAAGCSAASLALGYGVYKHCEPKYVFWL
jgi:ABC-type polysaccharide/polyol phosphate export permease